MVHAKSQSFDLTGIIINTKYKSSRELADDINEVYGSRRGFVKSLLEDIKKVFSNVQPYIEDVFNDIEDVFNNI